MSKWKVGDSVFSIIHGWGKVTAIDSKILQGFPIVCNFDRSGHTFTEKGFYEMGGLVPILFLEKEVPDIFLSHCPKPKKHIIKEVSFYCNICFDGTLDVFPTFVDARNGAGKNTKIIGVILSGQYTDWED